MQATGGDGSETTRGRNGLPKVEATPPAGDGVIETYPATMFVADGDGSETTRGRNGLPGGVVTPAGDGVIVAVSRNYAKSRW